MNGIRNKLGSDRGASITFALLLFLVCAVVSSVVIVAATTSAGRMSQLAQMDQRYYAVNSAAELLCGAFSGDDGKPLPVNVTYDQSNYYLSLNDENKKIDPLLKSATVELAKTLFEADSDGSFDLSSDGPFATEKLEVEAGSTTLTLSLKETLKNGLLEFEISNVPDAGAATGNAAGIYALRVTFASNIKRYTGDANKALISWKLHSIQKVRADEPVSTP